MLFLFFEIVSKYPWLTFFQFFFFILFTNSNFFSHRDLYIYSPCHSSEERVDINSKILRDKCQVFDWLKDLKLRGWFNFIILTVLFRHSVIHILPRKQKRFTLLISLAVTHQKTLLSFLII